MRRNKNKQTKPKRRDMIPGQLQGHQESDPIAQKRAQMAQIQQAINQTANNFVNTYTNLAMNAALKLLEADHTNNDFLTIITRAVNFVEQLRLKMDSYSDDLKKVVKYPPELVAMQNNAAKEFKELLEKEGNSVQTMTPCPENKCNGQDCKHNA
jgi:hypothetical protein